MIQFIFGLLAGIVVGLVMEWVIDWAGLLPKRTKPASKTQKTGQKSATTKVKYVETASQTQPAEAKSSSGPESSEE